MWPQQEERVGRSGDEVPEGGGLRVGSEFHARCLLAGGTGVLCAAATEILVLVMWVVSYLQGLLDCGQVA